MTVDSGMLPSDLPSIVSADDHVLEPPHLWTDRLPRRLRAVGPRVVRKRAAFVRTPGNATVTLVPSDAGQWVDVWHYEDMTHPLTLVSASAGFERDNIELRLMIFDEVRKGCYDQAARLADMDTGGVEGSLCFPNLFVRFCGQRFLNGKDKELARLCVEAYNNFILEEWCAGTGDRLIPCGIVPLWDVTLAAAETRRVAALGMRAVCFSEAPAHLGLPSMHSGYWTPLFEACADTGTVVMIHVGSSSVLPTPSDDAPPAVENALASLNSSMSLVDWLFSGLFVTHPRLQVCFAECQIGWIPYYLERADTVWHRNRGWAGVRHIPRPPSSYYFSNVHVSFYSDRFGCSNIDAVGVDRILFETDYPHSDGTWPDCREAAAEQTAMLDAVAREKVLRGNARRLFRV
jgi:predicted TIM-barrel fold metal-dependent hydrolase